MSDPLHLLKKQASSGYCWSIFFILAAIFLASPLLSNSNNSDLVHIAREAKADTYASGGPSETQNLSFAAESGAFSSGDTTPDLSSASSLAYSNPPVVTGGSALGVASPLSNIRREENGIIKYKVQKGDTVSEISFKFGISLETLRWANPGLKSFLSEDQELIILPISGVLYETREDDSLEAIASRHQISPELIKKYNPDYQKIIDSPGNKLVLPYASPVKTIASGGPSNLPVIKNYFSLPARGWNWGELHPQNAVDIADQCGSPAYSSAEGLVVEESGNGYWNQGYGNYILIEHPNGAKTKYAHTQKNLVKVGDYVAKGDKIALVGGTGNTQGKTGCHLHFEVHGAQNPFAVK